MDNEKNTRASMAFAAIDPYIQENIPSPVETVLKGKNRVQWGSDNLYPDYLLELTKTVPTLRSIINGTTDFVTGDAQSIQPLVDGYPAGVMNTAGGTIRELVDDMARNWLTYGGIALQVIRSWDGKPVEVYCLETRFVRSNKENTVFYYSEKWVKGYHDMVEYPAYMDIKPERWAQMSDDERNRNASSILFVKADRTQVYPFPVYGPAVKACETERAIDDYHLNAINNGFEGSAIVNFNNGIPSDEMKEEIEKDLLEKTSGHQNAGRILCSWNPNKESATTIETIKVEDYGDRYNTLANRCRQQIFTAFRAVPSLFGILTESKGFSEEEFAQAFRLYNRTTVRPIQRTICDCLDRIYGKPGVLTITPFSIEETATGNEQKVN